MKLSGKVSKEQIERLERAMEQAYKAHQAQESPQFSTSWVSSVMSDVRRSARKASALTMPAEMPRLVWRAASVVVFVSLLLVGSALTWNAERADAGFLALFNDAPFDPTLL